MYVVEFEEGPGTWIRAMSDSRNFGADRDAKFLDHADALKFRNFRVDEEAEMFSYPDDQMRFKYRVRKLEGTPVEPGFALLPMSEVQS